MTKKIINTKLDKTMLDITLISSKWMKSKLKQKDASNKYYNEILKVIKNA